jgi:hypothetical protein
MLLVSLWRLRSDWPWAQVLRARYLRRVLCFFSVNWYSFLHGLFSPIHVVETGCSWELFADHSLDQVAKVYIQDRTYGPCCFEGTPDYQIQPQQEDRKRGCGNLHNTGNPDCLWAPLTSVSSLDPLPPVQMPCCWDKKQDSIAVSGTWVDKNYLSGVQ